MPAKRNWERPEIDAPAFVKRVTSFIREQTSNRRAKGVVVGVSGGLDSAVVSWLLVRALGTDRVKGLFLPERDTPSQSEHHAREVARGAGFQLETLDLTPSLESLGIYEDAIGRWTRFKGMNRVALWGLKRFFKTDSYQSILEGPDHQVLRDVRAFFRIKHRLRMAILYHQAEATGCLVAGCLNRTEYRIGFFVPYGDDAGDLAPLQTLYKRQVRTVAAHLGLPKSVMEKSPSPDLFPGVTDEEILGMTYDEVDVILFALDQGTSAREIAERSGIAETRVIRVADWVKASDMMRRPAPVLTDEEAPDGR